MPEYKFVNKLYPTIDEFQCPNYKCKDCKLSCVGNYALDASGLWKLEWPAIKSLMEIAIT